MQQGLFSAHGAQPIKPSRWKPVYTDRFFNGYVTNRSPFRSPLSIFYADGYNFGRTDTLSAGANVEISPRLTLVRRPGCSQYSPTNATNAPNTFYSYRLANGSILVMMDESDAVLTISPSGNTSIYSKPATAGQSNFCGIGNTLYWGDGTQARAWNPLDNIVRTLGIIKQGTEDATLTFASYPSRGSATTVTGVDFSGGGYVSTVSLLNNNLTQSIEALVQTTSSASLPIISFESDQTGASATTFQTVYISGGSLFYSYWDGAAMQTFAGGGGLNDGQLHQVSVSVTYVADITNTIAYSASGPIKQSSAGSQNLNPDVKVTTNFSYDTSPSFSSAPFPATLQIFFYVDGKQVATYVPQTTFATGTGYWRIAQSSFLPGAVFTGVISEVTTRNNVIAGVRERFNALMLTGAMPSPGIGQYELAISQSLFGLNYWWKLNEVAGTTAVESVAGVNNGTYHPTVVLNTPVVVRYVPYAASTAFTLNQTIVDTNGNLQVVGTAGTSGATAPIWNTVIGLQTVDGTVVWTNIGPGALVQTIGRLYTYCYVNKYGHYSTAAPVSIGLHPETAGLHNIGGFTHPDPQVQYIALFATVDGGTTPFFLDLIPNSPATVWTYIDVIPDSDLNILMAAPQAHSNDPAPYGIKSLCFHMGRQWGCVGNLLYASGGPDTLVGNGYEAWPPANAWNYPSQIVKIVPHNSGLIVFTRSGIFLHAGGPSVTQFYPQPLFERIGVSSWNAVDATGNEVTLFSSGKQLLTIDLLNNQLTDIGFNIQPNLQNLDPTQVYVVRHHGGLDDAVFIGDGSTGWYKCIPRQPPDYSVTGAVWSPKADVLVDGGIVLS